MHPGHDPCESPHGRFQHWKQRRHRGPMRRWVGAHLHRMLFAAFAMSILITMGVVWGVFLLTSDGPTHWRREMRRMEVFASGRFALVWDRPAERAELAGALARAFDVRVEITNVDGTVLDVAGPEAMCAEPFVLPVTSASGARLGSVVIHNPRAWAHHPIGATALSLTTLICVLWLLAGIAARKLAKPLRELTRVAQEIGAGKLESRARLRHGASGEVGELARALNDMAERIEAQIGAQKALLGDVSHEMRTPLARVRLLVDIGRDEAEAGDTQRPDSSAVAATPTKRRDVLSEIETEVVEMDSLVGELLAGARMDFGALSFRELDVHELAARAAARAVMPGSDVGPTVEVTGDATRVYGDATLLARALGAMLDNARKHGRGDIALRVGKVKDDIVFAVEDQGPGFVAGEAAKVFAPFFRGNGAAHDEARGVGLGLALVRRIAEAHGGRAVAENRGADSGARVSMAIPARAVKA